jgi:hypothetical protein
LWATMRGMVAYTKAAVERAMQVQEVILRAMAKRITWWQAAEIIGISDRSMRRWRERYEQHGDTSRKGNLCTLRRRSTLIGSGATIGTACFAVKVASTSSTSGTKRPARTTATHRRLSPGSRNRHISSMGHFAAQRTPTCHRPTHSLCQPEPSIVEHLLPSRVATGTSMPPQ